MDDNELLFIIGHELSHIKSKHLIYGMLGDLIRIGALNAILATVPGFGVFAETAIRYAYFQWERAGEFSCDRGGYLACQNFNASCMALMKLAGLSKRHIQELNLEEFIKQGKDFKDVDTIAFGKIQKIILSYSSHPWAVSRVSELIKFNESGQYYNVLQRKTEHKIEVINMCAACGSQISSNLKFCGMCGTPVVSESVPIQQIPATVQMSNQELAPIQANMIVPYESQIRICDSCGNPNKSNASFCWSCGSAL
jgi:NADH pyrophosphatase NudC (nudix superfamily)